MKNKTILIIAGASVFVGAVLWAAFYGGAGLGGGSLSREERRIQRAIDDANHCEAASDCAQAAASVCPFGCYVHVHKDEAARIGTMLVEYQRMPRTTTCQYACIEYPGVDCVAGKCELKPSP